MTKTAIFGRPFSFGSKIPTHTELLRVDSLLGSGSDCSKDEPPTAESVQEVLSCVPFNIDLEDGAREAQFGLELDPRILGDARDAGTPTLASMPYDNEDPILVSRSDRGGLGLHPSRIPTQQLSDEVLPPNESQPYETSDFSSAITPDFDRQLPLTGRINETGAYEIPFADDLQSRAVAPNFDGNYSKFQQYPDQDAYRYLKKRRLTSDEIDALCAMETMSQTALVTINPKDLMLPQSNGTFIPQDLYDEDFATVPLDPEQPTFLPQSQSQSLSLSLNDFCDSQDVSFIPADITTGRGFTDFEPHQDEMPSIADGSAELHFNVSRDPDFSRTDRLYQRDESSCSRLEVSAITTAANHQMHPDIPHKPSRQDEGIRPQLNPPGTGGNPRKPILPPALLSDHDRLSLFLQLRGKQVPANTSLDITKPPENDKAIEERRNSSNEQDSSLQTHHRAPEDLLAATRAFVPPELLDNPTTPHTYLVSLDFVQQRRLVCALSSYNVRLVERDTLTSVSSTSEPGLPAPKVYSADISLIVAPHSGVVFFPLSALPSSSAYKTLLDALAAYSWRFSSLLLILVAFPRSQMLRATAPSQVSHDMPSSYSPPAMKAARRVRRDLALREGTGEKRTSCNIELAFADDVNEAAKLVRAFSDLVLKDCQIDINAYIGEEEQEVRTSVPERTAA